MIKLKIPHAVDTQLTKELARTDLQGKKVYVCLYSNRMNSHSVVHSHPYCELICPVSGSDVIYSVNGSLYHIHPGELVFLPAEIYHAGQYNVTGSTSDRLVAQIDSLLWTKAEEIIKPVVPHGLNDFLIIPQEYVNSFAIRELIENMSYNDKLEPRLQDAVHISQIVQLQLLMAQAVSTENIASESVSHPLAAKAVNYLQNHFNEPNLTVERLAQLLYTSREHLSRLFKDSTMESIHSYLTGLRMQQAVKILSEGGSVAAAAADSGFANYNSFLKAFRRRYKITPSQYRSQLIKRKEGKTV